MSPDNKIILAGDIGGTKTELGLFEMGKKRPSLKAVETYSSVNYSKFDKIVLDFLETYPVNIAGACFGLAGPVFNGQCKMTNLSWTISESLLKKRFKWQSVHIINDLVAMVRSIPVLKNHELYSLNGLPTRKKRNIGLIAPGTGLGKAFLLYDNGRKYFYIPTEGGHVDFPIHSVDEFELWKYLEKKFGHVSVERVVSGPGIVNIYQWLKSFRGYEEPSWLKKLFKGNDPAKIISETALAGKDPICVESIDFFISAFGSIAGNLALTGMTTGGLFLGGGIVPKILSLMKNNAFLESFTNKGRFKKFMESIPVKVILHKRPALLGAACFAFEMLGDTQ